MKTTGVDGNIRKHVLLTDFSIARPRDRLISSDSHAFTPIAEQKPGAWRLIDYETKLFTGKFLQASIPDAAVLTVPLGITGWHALSIGIAGSGVKQSDAAIEVRLTSDARWQYLRSNYWDAIVEEPWIMADLTGKDLQIRFPYRRKGQRPQLARLFSLRAVAIDPEDLKRLGRVEERDMMFINGGGVSSDEEPGAHIYEDAFKPFEGSEWNICCFGAGGADVVHFDTRIGTISGEGAWDAEPGYLGSYETVKKMIDSGLDPMKVAVDTAHAQGYPLIASIRNQLWTCEPPLDHRFRSRFYSAHPEYCCVEADGTVLGSKLSIGFKPVRDQLNGILRECLERGADGVALCIVRGFPLVRYEQPVLDRFRELFGSDGREADAKDPRIRTVWKEFATRWMEEIRQVLDDAGPTSRYERRKLALISGPDLEWNLQFGIDVESWGKDRLIDIVVPYPRGMETEVDRMAVGIEEYVRVLEGTEVQILPSLGSYADHGLSLGALRKRAHSFYEAGATGLSKWDTDWWMPYLDWDQPAIQKLWVEKYMPPSGNTVISLAGLERLIYTSRIGV